MQVMDSIKGSLEQSQRVYVSSIQKNSSALLANAVPLMPFMNVSAMQPDQVGTLRAT